MDGQLDGQMYRFCLYSTGLYPSGSLRGCCPAHIKATITKCQSRARVPMTISCLWATSLLFVSVAANVRFRRCCCKPPKDAAGHWDIVNRSWKYFPGKKMLQNVQNTIFWAICCKNSFLVATKPQSCCKALKHSRQLIEVVLDVFQLKTAIICLCYPSFLICCKSTIFEKLLQSQKVAAKSCNIYNRSWQCCRRFFQQKSSVKCLQ